MKAYHGNPELKRMMVEEAIKHRQADSLVQKFGYGPKDGEKFKGCAVGCTLHSIEIKLGQPKIGYSDHAAYEKYLGIPQILAHLEDGIFEALPKAEARTWPERFLEATNVGSNLSGVGDKFLRWLLADPTDGVIKFAKNDRTKQAIQAVADLYAKCISGENVTAEQWHLAKQEAHLRAFAAYSTAARDATDTGYAAQTAVYAASIATEVAYASAVVPTRNGNIVRQSEKLLELIKEAI